MITKLGQVTVETQGCAVGGAFDSPANVTRKIYSDGNGNHSVSKDPFLYTHTAANCVL